MCGTYEGGGGGCAVVWYYVSNPLRRAALDLWDSHPARCVRHVPPFETFMAPAECVCVCE